MAGRARDFDHTFKVVMIGDTSVGKSCILVRFADDEFQESYMATIGVDFRYRTLRVGDKIVKLQIWDTAGQERFKTITSAYYRGADGVIVVYDTTDRETFNNVETWVNQVSQYVKPSAKKIMVGNKCDLESERQVTQEEAEAKAAELGFPFMEVSAKVPIRVDELFVKLATDVLADLPAQNTQNNRQGGVSLTETIQGLAPAGCC